ncbi:HlyD family efflux transporter periplasmic adaptor subunit [Pontimonas sp.]|nr:HlyD family efflux transporter periplasmic adaptor subunit [Pontimonas sp.]
MKTRTKVITGIAIGAVVIAGGAGIAVGLAPAQETTVLTEEVAVRDVDVTVAASGTVSPAVEFGLQFPGAAAATLASLSVEVGDTVEAGAVLAAIETASLESAVTGARASVAAARASIANAETTADQARQAISAADQAITAAELAIENVVDEFPSSSYPQPNEPLALLNAQKQKVTAEASLETARRQLEAYYPQKASAEASLRSALDQLDAAQADLSRATMTAPVASTVIAVASQLGEPIGTTSVGVNGTSGFIVLAALDTFVVEADFAESDVVGIADGQSVTLEFDALPDARLEGLVTEVDAYGSVDPSGGSITTYGVTISVPTPPAGLRAGMTAQASITTEEATGVISAPVTAISEREDGYVALVQSEDGSVEEVAVEIGVRGGYYVEIVSGLTAGDRVVTGSDGELPSTSSGFGGPPEGARD